MAPFDKDGKPMAEAEVVISPKPEPEALKPEPTRQSRADEHNQLYSQACRGTLDKSGYTRLQALRHEMMQRGEMPCDCTAGRGDFLVAPTPILRG